MNRFSRRSTGKQAPIERVAAFARAQLIQAVDDLIQGFAGTEVLDRVRHSKDSSSRYEFDVELARFHDLAEALRQWHSNDTFLARDGSPLPLPRDGKLSLMTLARHVAETTPKAKALVSDLLEFGILDESDGRFRPARRSAVLGKANALNLAYAAITAIRLLKTIHHNVSAGTPRLYERQVSDVTIRAADLPIYLRFIEDQAQYLIDSADDWLSRRQVDRDTRTHRIKVGMGAFAWAELPSRKAAKSRVQRVPGTRARK